MKKQLLAVAVATAFAAPAIAQNVSVFGYLETGIENTKTSGTTNTGNATNLTTGMFGSSRLGFQGSEDLGGGLKAGFRLEMSASALGQGGSSDNSTVTAGPLFNRGAEINLSGAFGTIKMGKLDHPGLEGNEVNTVGNIALFDTAVEGINDKGTSSDAAGTILYVAPIKALGGTLTLGWTGKDDGVTQTSGYDHGGMRSYQLAGVMNGLTYKIGGGSMKAAAANDSTKVLGGGVGYDFGALNVGFQMQNLDVPNNQADYTETVLTAKYNMGGGLDVRAAYSTVDVAESSTSDQTKLTLAVAKALSKRTTAYVAYRSTDVNTTTNNDTRELGIYVGHSF